MKYLICGCTYNIYMYISVLYMLRIGSLYYRMTFYILRRLKIIRSFE